MCDHCRDRVSDLHWLPIDDDMYTILFTGLKVLLRNEEYAHNSVVMLESIGEDSNPLVCKTDLEPCCKGSAANGNWCYPNNTAIKNNGDRYGFYRNRGTTGEVYLRRRPGVLSPMGSYCCEIPTTNSYPQNERICVILRKSVL